MSTSLIELLKQAQALSPSEKIELAMALLEQTRAAVSSGTTGLKWSDVRGIYVYPMFGEDAQIAINRLRDEWGERELWSPPDES